MEIEKIIEIGKVIDKFNYENNLLQENMTHVEACLMIEKILNQ